MKRILCGPHAVEEALRTSPRSIHLLLADPTSSNIKSLSKRASVLGIQAKSKTKEELDSLSGKLRHQGIIAITGDFPYLDLEGLLKKGRSSGEPLLFVALDQIQDVQNLGSIMRSSVALGAHGLILCKHQAAKVSPAAVRVSAGASEHAAISRVTNLGNTLGELRSEGVLVVGMDSDGQSELSTLDLTAPVALVLGSEGKGIRRLVKKNCDVVARIPLTKTVSSLNVSMACSIGLYEVIRQRS